MLGSQMGVINAMRTGNVIVDMAICMAIPVVFGLLVKLTEQLTPHLQKLVDYLKRGGSEHYRIIEYELKTTTWGSVLRGGKDERNNMYARARRLVLLVCRLLGREG